MVRPRRTLSILLVALLCAAGPADARKVRPGRVLGATPLTAQVLPGVAMPGSAWRVVYRSTTATGTPTRVSGTILVPENRAAGNPLIGYAIGTQGLADRCAPSAQLAAGSEYEAALVEAVLEQGWTVALTDYPGLGTRGRHPYVVGRALGPAVLDSMRAARNLPAAGVPRHGPAAIMGYSEGGGAAGWAIQLQPRYAPDIPLTAAAVGGVVADLPRIGASLDGSPYAFLLGYTLDGFDAAYPKLRLAQYLNAKGRELIAKLRDTCVFDAIGSYPFGHAADLTTRDIFTLPAFQRVMARNSLGTIAPQTPVFLQHARLDQILPYDQAVALKDQWCALGVHVTFADAVGADHITGGVGASAPAIAYLAARLAGEPPPATSCELPSQP
ncbi:MAG: hypothetical protein QOF76_1591 [Solirubrobacteraceae bacterium]|nr:hypothetical protein [Solirubrobacteraceae bacterium]